MASTPTTPATTMPQLAFGGAIMLATLSLAFTNVAQESTVLRPRQQQQVAAALEHDAEVMTNTALKEQLAGRRPAVQEEILQINTDARHVALQIALLVPILAALVGFGRSFRMLQLPEPKPRSDVEGIALG